MHLHFNDESTSRYLGRFNRLGLWFFLALGIIAAVAIAGQVLIQLHLSDQLGIARILNVAGRQRMLSGQMSKAMLMLAPGQSTEERKEIKNTLEASLSLWEAAQFRLQNGNDSLQVSPHKNAELDELFAKVTPHFDVMRRAGKTIIALLQINPVVAHDSLRPAVARMLEHEDLFLSGMDDIAEWYVANARKNVSVLSAMEYVLLSVLLLIILLEILFIFRPTAKNINKTMNQLVDSERNARKLSKEIGALYSSLEKSYEQVAMVNQPAENPRLFAKADQGGNLTFISDNFRSMAPDLAAREGRPIADLFAGMEQADDWMDNVIDTVSDGHFWQGELHYYPSGETRWVMVIITPVYNHQDEIEELVVMGTDITQRKFAEQNMKQKNRAEIEKKINQQKFRSVLILEGQEEERNRIAMDIHDGIGQMLTSLKYQIESIDVKSEEKAMRKISEVDQLIKQVIREVRRVTFNLKPTVLGDYGLQAALKVFIQETAKLVDVKLIYTTSGEIGRLPQKIENNIFRIVQEAINNAIKYSDADKLEVSLSQVDDNLVITVRDEGKGFDTRLVEARSVNIDSGRGFFNMYERTEYVNGQLRIQSRPHHGTTVTLTIPVKNPIPLEV